MMLDTRRMSLYGNSANRIGNPGEARSALVQPLQEPSWYDVCTMRPIQRQATEGHNVKTFLSTQKAKAKEVDFNV